jgi:ribonuclease HI
MKAVSMIINSSEAVSSVVFLTDSRSVLEALINNKSPDLARTMNELSTICKVTIQWIPAHCGITGNEEADQLAKFGAQSEQPDVQISFKEKVIIIKALKKPRQELDAYHSLNRPQQVMMVRLHSGHNRLNAHMNKKYRLF